MRVNIIERTPPPPPPPQKNNKKRWIDKQTKHASANAFVLNRSRYHLLIDIFI